MSECIIGKGTRRADGYIITKYKGWRIRAHRLAWETAHGPIPAGMLVCHMCDNRGCINVEHLFLGTHADNNADMASKKRSTLGERNASAKLSEEQVRQLKAEIGTGIPQKELAAKYGVSSSTVTAIKQGRQWSHVS